MIFLFYQMNKNSVRLSISEGLDSFSALENAQFLEYSIPHVFMMVEDLNKEFEQLRPLVEKIPYSLLHKKADKENEEIINSLTKSDSYNDYENPLSQFIVKKTIEVLEVATDEKNKIFKNYYHFYIPYFIGLLLQTKNKKALINAFNRILYCSDPKRIFDIIDLKICLNKVTANNKIITDKKDFYQYIDDSLDSLLIQLAKLIIENNYEIKKCVKCQRHYILTKDNNKKYCSASCKKNGVYKAEYDMLIKDELDNEFTSFTKHVEYHKSRLKKDVIALEQYNVFSTHAREELKSMKKKVLSNDIEKEAWNQRINQLYLELDEKYHDLYNKGGQENGINS